MPDFGQMVMIEKGGPQNTDLDSGIALGGGFILREDGEILSPDTVVNSIEGTVPISDIGQAIFGSVKGELKDQVKSELVDEVSERIKDKIMEYLQDLGENVFDEFQDLVVAAINELGSKVPESIDIVSLSQHILDAIVTLI